jgi:hypothetical protein
MSKGSVFLGFTIGSAIGFLVSRQYFSEKYRKIADEEIESVKEVFKKKGDHIPIGCSHKNKPPAESPAKSKKGDILKHTNYAEFLGYDTQTTLLTGDEEPVVVEKEPYVIPPEAYGEAEGYDQISLTYYSDGTLADDADSIMGKEEIAKTVGAEFINHFGEYEDDSVFVRNDVLKCDYEILLDQRSYSEVAEERPYILEE